MKLKALEIDFTDQIKARSLEKMTYVIFSKDLALI